MADRVKITNTRSVGKEVGKQVRSQLDDRLKAIEREVKSLSTDIESLENRIEQIEKTKARAQREAIEDHKERVQQQLEEKREEYEQRLGAILSEYRNSISRLKGRFLNSISGRHDQFRQVEAEFDDVGGHRAETADAADSVGPAAAAAYEDRLEHVEDARTDFLNAIDDFLADREGTAATIDALQTDLRGISDTTRVQVPFWVVGVEVDGVEELRVYPVLEQVPEGAEPDRAHPYADTLRTHPDHGFEDMTEAVREYVSQDPVWDSLVDEEQTFADPDFLARQGVATDRFVDSLAAYELGDRSVDGDESGRDRDGDRDRDHGPQDREQEAERATATDGRGSGGGRGRPDGTAGGDRR